MRLGWTWQKCWIVCFAVYCLNFNSFAPANAQTPVSVELVLAVDTSLSVNDFEFRLQMEGIAKALRSPEIVELISLHDGVAIAVLQWAGWTSDTDSIVWRILKTPTSVHSFADEVADMNRHGVGNLTAIGSAIEASLFEIATNEYAGKVLKIDVSGDGISNAGPMPSEAKLLANIRGVTINGLAILTDVASLDDYYRREVVTGQGAFVVKAAGYEDFARAMRLKLLRELAPVIGFTRAPKPGRS